MYDLDNGTENIKVKEIVANKITAVTSAITTEYDDLVVNGKLTVKGGGSANNIIIGTSAGHPDYVKSDSGLDLKVENSTILSLTPYHATFNGRVQVGSYTTAARPVEVGAYNAGSVIYDSTLGKLILWNGTAWINLDGTALS